jgi:hypothetical protein
MSVLILSSGNLGPFKSIETLDDRLRCDNTDYPFTVIGDYTISDDDSLAPIPPVPPVPVPEVVTMRQARLALLQAGKLSLIDAAIDAQDEPLKSAARIEWEYATEVRRDWPLVQILGPAIGTTEADLDDLFILAATL